MNDFYFTNELVGKGLPILSKSGAIAKQRLIEYIGKLLLNVGYVPLSTPHIGNLSLFETSGHFPYYKDSMFPVIENEEDKFLLKPMNCPFHIMAYKEMGVVSYKELPVKFYEFGQVYRNEDSGAVNGLFRARSFTQDDGHIFCRMDQIQDVIGECVCLIKTICDKFKLELSIKYSKRDPNSNKYVGDVGNWDVSEDILKSVCYEHFKDSYVEDIGGAAFYGPKIDFVAKDKLKREWQLGTIQLDFNLPELFNVSYVSDDGSKQTPVLIHRALLGSIERFLAVLLENDLVPNYLRPFNLGVIWIGEKKEYLAQCINIIKGNQVYPTVIEHPFNLKEAMKKLYSNGITNIVIIGKREEEHRMVNFNKSDISFSDFGHNVRNMFSI